MLKKHFLLSLILLGSSSVYANVPIESRGLSQSGSSLGSSASDAAAPNLNWQLMQKNQQLENDIRVLRGQLEEQSHAIEQLKKDLENRYTDLDQRLELLNHKIDPESQDQTTEESVAPTSDSVQPITPESSTPTTPASTPNQTQPNTTPSTSNEPSTASRLKVSNQAATVVPAGLGNAVLPANSVNSTELEKAAYTVALDAYKQGGAAKAIAPMENFIKNHPNSIYTPNAYFWLAEFNLAITPVNYNNAKKSYQVVSEQYPTSSKAPRSLYQLYSIAHDVEHNNTLAQKYKSQLLQTYPQSQEASFFKN